MGGADPEIHQARPSTLTAEQLERIATLRSFAAKKQKITQLLIASDLTEEAESHQQAAEKALVEAAEIEIGETMYPAHREITPA